MITIKLFGEGCQVHLLESSAPSLEVYHKIASALKLPLHEAFLDVYFLEKLDPIPSLEALIIDSFIGTQCTRKSSLEIWFDRKKVAKIKLLDLLNFSTLFPLYHLQKIKLERNTLEKGIYLKETIVGCIGVYTIDSDSFNIDFLSFIFLESIFTTHELLVNFTYKNVPFKKIKEDCLTQYQEVIIL